MLVGVTQETYPGESRVALVPAELKRLSKAKIEVIVEAGAGRQAGFLDSAFEEAGAQIATTRKEVFEKADLVVQVRGWGANPEHGAADAALLRSGQAYIGFLDPLGNSDAAKALAETGSTAFSMELVPRTTRAQSMDALSSMATIMGTKTVLLAANTLPKMFPMMMTAAGTIAPAKVLVIGAGVAGLQAIATARRLGAVVEAYDIRPAVKEEVQSLGAKFVELAIEAEDAADSQGYAKAQSDAFIKKQQDLLGDTIAGADVVITTALVQGRKAPVLVPTAMVERMRPGSVVVDMAAEAGGNCEETVPGETIVHNGVTILGPVNLASSIPAHASQMYARNVSNLLQLMCKDGELVIDTEDEIIVGCMVSRNGEVTHPRVREILGLSDEAEEPAAEPAHAAAAAGEADKA